MFLLGSASSVAVTLLLYCYLTGAASSILPDLFDLVGKRRVLRGASVDRHGQPDSTAIDQDDKSRRTRDSAHLVLLDFYVANFQPGPLVIFARSTTSNSILIASGEITDAKKEIADEDKAGKAEGDHPDSPTTICQSSGYTRDDGKPEADSRTDHQPPPLPNSWPESQIFHGVMILQAGRLREPGHNERSVGCEVAGPLDPQRSATTLGSVGCEVRRLERVRCGRPWASASLLGAQGVPCLRADITGGQPGGRSGMVR